MAGRKSDFTLPTNTLDDLFSSQEERNEAKLSKIRDIPLSEIDDFPNHPFQVREDEDMFQLVESIKERGVITPATVRQKEDGRYELVSGHRRKKACELAGFETLRCEVVDLDRDEATILMVESNFQRSQILPSEKAYAYGCPYVQEDCDVLKPSDNVVIYGHHMNNGSMFADLEKFKSEDFWREHRTIAFHTLTDKNEYEILAAFKTVVYTNSPDSFRYYRFTDAQSPEEFAAFVEKCKELSLYDTGISAEYGDKLITLSTCEYSRTNGRLVVVAKKITESSDVNAPANDGAAEIPS